MKYTGKYKKMVEQFRKDGADEALIEKFIREEMERDAFEKENGLFRKHLYFEKQMLESQSPNLLLQINAEEPENGTTDLQAYRVWKSWPEERREMYLNNAFCGNCRDVASFAPGYGVRKDRWGLVIEGFCAKCGGKIRRVCD